jgi:ABC-type glycerol-3-phosphate transport system substrate-binding protein
MREPVVVSNPKAKEIRMNVNMRKWRLLVAATSMVALVVLAGCSSKQESNAPATTSHPAPPAAAPSGEDEHGETVEKVAPAATLAGIWTQIADEQSKLSTAIQNGQLKDVHHLAFAIRDLVLAAADKAKAASPASGSKLDGMVEQVKASATKLDELGDAGNLSGTQTEYAKLETILGAIKTVTGAK